MTTFANKFQNSMIDWLLRAQAIGLTGASAAAGTGLTNSYIALFRATAGISPRSTAVTAGQTTVPATSNGHFYRCTTAGTTGASEPTWGTTSNGTTTDGTAVWTEMLSDFQGNTTNLTSVEVSGNAYTRYTVASSLANWAGTQGATTTAVSSGTSGTTSNNTLLTYPTPTPLGWGVAAAVGIYDASTVGNLLFFGVMATPKTINSGDTVTFPISSVTFALL